MEQIIGLRFKLIIFRIRIDGKARLLNNNNSVVGSSSKLESTLNNKHSLIAYYLVRSNVEASVVHIGCIEGISNIAYALTKRLAVARRSK